MQMRLVELSEYFQENNFTSYVLEIDYLLKITFQSVHVFFAPDVVLLRNENGDYVDLCGVSDIFCSENVVRLKYVDRNSEREAVISCKNA